MPVILAAGLVSAWSATAADMGSDFTTNSADANTNSADADTTGFYESVDAGVAILQNMTAEIQGFPAGTFKFNVGPRFDVSAGYDITENVAVELQGGFARNSITQFGSFLVQPGFSSDLWTVPVMVNGIYKDTFEDHWQAYGGVGVGAVFSFLTQGYSGGENSSTSDSEFGYQVMAGIKYLFNDHLEFGLGYNFLGSTDHHWSPTPGVRMSPTYMHSVLLSLTYKF